MRIVFLINGPKQHGIVRAGLFFADAMSEMYGASIAIVETTDPLPGPDVLDEIRAKNPDIVVLLASCRTGSLWGAVPERGRTIAAFAKKLNCSVAVYTHDVYWVSTPRSFLRHLWKWVGTLVSPKRRQRNDFKGLLSWRRPLDAAFYKSLTPTVAGYIVSNQIELRRLQRYGGRTRNEVVPHFIEERTGLVPGDEAKGKLGLEGKKVVTLLGFIMPRKDYHTAIRTLALLPDDYQLVLAGRVSQASQQYFDSLTVLIGELGLDDRVTNTGYIEDDLLDIYLSATDVAICPFHSVSASGSLATWLASRTPIVASDLELFRAYREELGDVIRLATPGRAESFCEEILGCMAMQDTLREKLLDLANVHGSTESAREMHNALQRISGLS